MEEKDIIKGCLNRDPRAYRAIVDQYSAYLFAICKRYVIDNDLAKDCLQESLVQIINKIELYEERGKFKSWMGTVTVKKCLDILRKEKRHKSSDLDSTEDPFNQENVSYELERQDVMRFLQTLPENYRIAINMFLVEGYSHKEIAQVLDVTESTSRSLVSRARKMIVEAFQEDSMAVSFINEEKNKKKESRHLKVLRS